MPAALSPWHARFQASLAPLADHPAIDLTMLVVGKKATRRPTFPVAAEVYARWFTRDGQHGAELYLSTTDAADVSPRGDLATGLINRDLHAAEEVALLRGLVWVEDHPDGGDYTGVLADADASGVQRLYLHHRGATFPLRLDWETYLQALLDLRGLGGWHWLFADLAGHGMPPGSTTAQAAASMARDRGRASKALLKVAHRLFPDVDLAPYEAAARPPAPRRARST